MGLIVVRFPCNDDDDGHGEDIDGKKVGKGLCVCLLECFALP